MSTQGIDSLAQAMVDLAAQGMTLEQVAARVGLPVEVCHQRMLKHLEDAASTMSIVQMRMLQLRRLEHIISALWEQVMSGDLLTQGRNVRNLIDVINQITELMDLRKDRLRDETIRFTQAQTMMVLNSIDMPKVMMLAEVLEWISPDQHEKFTEFWNRRFPELAAQGVEKNAEFTIRMGADAGAVELMPVT